MNLSIRHDDPHQEKCPYSRLFVVCSKQMREDKLRTAFEKFGDIEDAYMPRDRNTGESKGIAYIKFRKTSFAAAAIQNMHLKTLEGEEKPLKVMVAATNKNDDQSSNEDRYKRLFIKVPRHATEDDIRKHFQTFGALQSVRLQRDKITDENKGFAYVVFKTFLDAAMAFEQCDRSYKPVFAMPKDELKRNRNSLELKESFHSSNSSMSRDYYPEQYSSKYPMMPIRYEPNNCVIKSKPQGFNTIHVTCTPQLEQRHLEKLFSIVPGMTYCQYSVDKYNGVCKAIIAYEEESSAAFAVERLNNYEFPSGEIVFVKPDNNPLSRAAKDLTSIVNSFKDSFNNDNTQLLQLADAIAKASTLIKAATTGKAEQEDDSFCNVKLPEPKPCADEDSRVAQRCFIVCKPQPPPIKVLRDVFCRFGDLINVSTIPNKTFGFVKYASVRAAKEAIASLNGAVVCGARIKVMEADDRPKDYDHINDKEQTDHNTEVKRIKLDRNDTEMTNS